MDTVKHLGNYIDTTNGDIIESSHKKSTFIGYVIGNKLACNYKHLQPNIKFVLN